MATQMINDLWQIMVNYGKCQMTNGKLQMLINFNFKPIVI